MAFITTSAVHLASDSVIIHRKFGGAAIDGNTVYLDTSDSNRWKQADSNLSAVTAGQDGMGILLHDVAAADEYGFIATGGTIYVEVTAANLTKGSTYVVGPNAGSMGEDGDVTASGNWKTIIGVAGENGFGAGNGDALHLDIHVSNKQIP